MDVCLPAHSAASRPPRNDTLFLGATPTTDFNLNVSLVNRVRDPQGPPPVLPESTAAAADSGVSAAKHEEDVSLFGA